MASVEYVAVLPDDVKPDTQHRYLRLPHPRSGLPQLYLPTGKELHEVVKLAGARGRTWFHGEHISRGEVLLHAPFDAFFLAAPIALSLIPGPFQPLPDLLSTAASSAQWALRPPFAPTAAPEQWNRDVGRLAELPAFVRAFEACCERKLVPGTLPSPPPEGAEAGTKGKGQEEGEKYYRPSREAVRSVLRRKVAHVVAHIEEFDHLLRALGRDGLLGADPALLHSAKQKAAIDTLAAYLPPALAADLTASYDFAALDAYQRDRAAALAAAAAPAVSEKKAKAGDKRKAAPQGSRGVEALKKANTRGMAKMTSFFKPKDK